MPFKKGAKPGPGRPKGTQNRETVEIKKVIDQIVAYTNEHREAILDEVRQTNPGLLLNIIAKVAPKDLNITSDVPMAIVQLPKVEKANDKPKIDTTAQG